MTTEPRYVAEEVLLARLRAIPALAVLTLADDVDTCDICHRPSVGGIHNCEETP